MVQLPPATEIEVVVVHPPRLAPLGGEAAFSTIVIPAAELQARARTDEALKQAPGVSLFRRTGSSAANPTTQGVSLRSIAPSGAGRALVTLDGVPQNDPFGGWVIWSALPSEGLDGATVVRGAGAGPYGAGALTGVIALSERGAVNGLASLDVSAASGQGRVGVAGGAEHFLITGAASKDRGYYAVRGPRRGAADQPVSLDDASLAVRAQGDLAGVQAAARAGAYMERRGAGLVGARSVATGVSGGLTLAQPASEGVGGWRVQAWVRSSDLKNSSAAVAAGRTGTTPASDQYGAPTLGYGLNAALQGERGTFAWEIGADARMADGEVRERFRFMNGAFTRDRLAGGRTMVGGAHAEGVVDEGRLLAIAGIRVDGWESSRSKRQERDLLNGQLVLDQTSPNASGVTPTARLGLRYDVGDALALRAAAYTGFRVPTLNELHRPFRVGNDITEANALMKPETLQGAELGLGGEGWNLTGFYNRLQDPIANVTIGIGPGTFPTAGFVPAGGVLRQRRNAGVIEAWGLEGDSRGALGEAVDWRAAFAYTQAEVKGGSAVPQLTGKRPAQSPEWTVTGGLAWRAGERLTISSDVRYESARWEDDLNTRRLGSGAQVDARAAWRLGPHSEVYVRVENLTQEDLETGETADGVESYAAPRLVSVGFAFRR